MSNNFVKGFIEGKLYDYVPLGFNLSYEDAKKEMQAGSYVSREDWSGFHFIDKSPEGIETYVIIVNDGSVILNPEEIYHTDKKDWGIVNIINKPFRMENGKFICGN